MKNLFLSLLTLAFAMPVFAADLYIDDGGDDTTNECLLDTTPCLTLEHVLTLAESGDTIHMDSGTYATTGATFPLMVGEGVSILGAGSEVTNLSGATGVPLLSYLNHQGMATLSGLAMRNTAGNAINVNLSSSADLSLFMDDVWLNKNGNRGFNVDCSGAFRLELKNSKIDYNDDGIYMRVNGDRDFALLLENNVISDNLDLGFSLNIDHASAVVAIIENFIERNNSRNVDIETYSAPIDLLIKNNTITDSVQESGLIISNSSGDLRAEIVGNTFTGNDERGFSLTEYYSEKDVGTHLLFHDNVINNNAYGVYLDANTEGRLYANVEGNAITENSNVGVYEHVDSRAVADVMIKNNTISLNQGHGFELSLGANHSIIDLLLDGNTVEDNTGTGVNLSMNCAYVGLNATLRNNTIQRNDDGIYLYGYSSENQMSVDILNNTISDNRADGVDISGTYGMMVKMKGNVISDNVDNGVFVNYGDDGFGLNLLHNTFGSNQTYAVYNQDNNSPVLARYNWWGTTDPGVISAMIYDEEDGESSYVVFENPLDSTLVFEPTRSAIPEEGGESVLIMALEDAPPFVASAGINKLVVMFGENEALAVDVVLDGRGLYAVAPPHAPGPVDISVTNPGGQSGIALASLEYTHTLYDTDNDGVHDDLDNCLDIPNTDQANADGDALGNACDDDDDGDSVLDDADNCVLVANTDQADMDSDGIGDACDGDMDGDGIPDVADNCPMVANPAQTNTDGDEVGNDCDEDDDNDGVPDTSDLCVFTADIDQNDLDGDGVGDACDSDADGNGVLDDVDAVQNSVETSQPEILVEKQGCSAVGGHAGLIPFALFGLALAFIRRRRA